MRTISGRLSGRVIVALVLCASSCSKSAGPTASGSASGSGTSTSSAYTILAPAVGLAVDATRTQGGILSAELLFDGSSVVRQDFSPPGVSAVLLGMPAKSAAIGTHHVTLHVIGQTIATVWYSAVGAAVVENSADPTHTKSYNFMSPGAPSIALNAGGQIDLAVPVP